MKVKPGVTITQLDERLKNSLIVVEDVFNENDSLLVITSGDEGNPEDGVHKPDSRHYKHQAIDCRAHHLTMDTISNIVASLRDRLGPKFYIQSEIFDQMKRMRNHIHIQLTTNDSVASSD